MRDFLSEKAEIIVVDDEPLNRKVANRMLRDWFTIREASSGAECLELVKKVRTDLILLDVHMPGMSGHDVINSLKKDKETRDIPVVFATADGDRETEASGLMEGADDFITKPFRQDILVQRLSRIIELHFLKSNLEEEVARQTAKAEERSRQIEEMSLQTILTLANVIDSKDPYSAGHSSRVSRYAVLMAEALGWEHERVENLRYAALLHDIGKIAVPDSILNNPKKLDEKEFEVVKSHASAGADLLKSKMMVVGAEDVARHHHERFDGTGYPGGLAGDEISQESRIVAIADAFDAMSSKRVFRRAFSAEYIRQELIDGKGKQFDPYLLDVFMGLWDHGLIDKAVGEFEETDVSLEGSSALLKQVMESFVSQSGEDSDVTTGLHSRTTGERLIARAMQEDSGCFIFFDVDNLKKINDTNGHKSGDKVLRLMGNTMTSVFDANLCCRLGGDEFIVFMPKVTKDEAEKAVQRAEEIFLTGKNSEADIAVASLSAGLVMCSPYDTYVDVYNRADKALYFVKQNGKEGYSFYNEDSDSTKNISVDINKLVRSIKTSGSYEGAMDVEYRQFTKLFEYVANLEKRYEHSFKLIMISIDVGDSEATTEEIERAMLCMEQSIRQTIRNVDIVTRYSKEQFLAILLEANQEGVQVVIDRIFAGYYKIFGSDKFKPFYTIANLGNSGDTK